MEASSSRDSPLHFPASQTQHHHPYFTPTEVDILSEQQRGKMSITQEDRARQQACGFIEAIGSRVGFPRRTIATAQNLYHRFHLFFARKDFNYHDVTLAALYVSTKMHDTLKKPRELLMVSYAVRFPEQAAKSKSIAGEIDMDPAVVEADRQRLLAVERLILETICFNFTSRMPFPYVIKIGRELKASKKLTKFAWRLTIDSQRTLSPLQFPPHVVAVACINLAALLSSFEKGPTQAQPGCASDHQIAAMLRTHGPWERKFQAQVEDLELIAHALLDLLIAAAQNPSASASPSTPSSPSAYSPYPHSSRNNALNPSSNPHIPPQPSPCPYNSDQLIRLKISLRESEHKPRERTALFGDVRSSGGGRGEAMKKGGMGGAGALGKNEGTVRFLFGPNGAS
ncbi:cyclin-like protein [Stereum hirsutum FP-91666 SS1]|uniref:cyclin-like protein n=1 Tax=Stereum hirsutum (strain FP-91666) TaxID=721885 RepID=UPI000444A537|nr:cyclin-like protein [Stereum hirsutum FP-91666 SS1]EIM85971.1 cyclin-like protein [Stereum hirsutum FP-91666 SS1]